MRRFKSFMISGAVPAGIIIIWYILASMKIWSAYVLPSPLSVWHGFTDAMWSGLLWKHIGNSLWRVVQGFSLAVIVAVPLAVIMSLNRTVHRMLEGPLQFFRHVPPLALLPLLVLWFGIGEGSKLAIVFLATVYPIFLNTLMGFNEVDGKLLEMGRQYGLSRRQIFYRISIPSAIPYILSGLRIGLGYSWRSLIGAEMIAAASGIGYWILDAQTMARSDVVIAGIIVIGLCGTVFDAIVKVWANRFFRRYMKGGV